MRHPRLLADGHLNGHQGPFRTDAAFFKLVDEWADAYAALHRRIMPLGEGEAHFDLDSWGGWLQITPNGVCSM